jgi:hypothetical protein
MLPIVYVGSIFMEEQPRVTQLLGLEVEPYSGDWGMVKALNGFTLDRKIHAAGWNFFFMASEIRVTFFGALGATKIQGALKRIVATVRCQNFNSFEVTSIAAKSFLGVPYGVISAHSRHIQQNGSLDDTAERRVSRRGAEFAKG